MEIYKTWVRSNREYLHSLESLANGLTWFLPERFSDSEIGPEAVTAIVGIITAINEHIIDTTPAHAHIAFKEPSSFPFSLCISVLKDLETLVEVVAQQYYGDDKKWNFIAVTEATKVLVRLALFRNGGYKMLLHGGVTPNVEKSPDDLGHQHIGGNFSKPGWNQGPNQFSNGHGQSPWNPEGRALSALSRFGDNARLISDPVWLRRIQTQHGIMQPQTTVVERPNLRIMLSEKGLCGKLFVMGELLFLTRPLIYVLFIRKYGVRSWIPWFLSIVVDFIGVGFLTGAAKPIGGGEEKRFHFSPAEKDELKRRKLLWAFYLMRDPFFTKYTRQRLESTEKLLEPVPVVGFLTSKIVELVVGAQTRYTYMSGS